MKSILFFFIFFLIGCGLIVGYRYITSQNDSLFSLKPTLTSQFSLTHAPSESLQGNIATMSGTVNWLSRTATKSIRLKSSRSIQQGEEISTGNNGHVVVIIHNAAAVSLSSNSQVSFIQLLPVNLVIEQDKGEVSYENKGEESMSIRTDDVLAEINRAVATITVDPDNNLITVTVVKGIVREGYEDSQNISNVVTVNAGSQFIFDETTKEGTVQ